MVHPSRYDARPLIDRRSAVQLLQSADEITARNRRDTTNDVPLDPELLADIAAGLARVVSPELLPDEPATTGDPRRWAKVLVTGRYEAWLIAWPPGSGLDLHDHGGSAGVFQVVRGTLDETTVDGNTRGLGAGDVATFGPAHVHGVRNRRREEAMSIHVYSPPRRAVRFAGAGDTVGATVLALRPSTG
jgi:mannose-6-phosphate isomerase-like protein (cupin superfamily)